MKATKTPKRYVNIRVDEQTYDAIRKLAYKRRTKLINVLRAAFI